jgi:hypothetical protein
MVLQHTMGMSHLKVTQYNMALYTRWPYIMIINSQENTNIEHI